MKFVKCGVVASLLLALFLVFGCSDKELENINSYIEKTEDFKGGSVDYDKRAYSSEYWELDFEFDEDWVMHTPDQMAYIAETSKDSIVAAGLKALEKENAGKEYIEAYKKSVRILPEFAADYYLGEALCGTVLGYSIVKYSGETESVDNVVPGMLAVMEDNTAKERDVIIRGEKYTGVEGVMTRYREETNALILAREKDGVYFVIMIGYYDDGSTVEAFLDMIK